MNKFAKMLSKGEYNQLYEVLESIHFQYDLVGFACLFKKVSSEKKYAYLTYAISRAETPELHLLVCDFVLFTDTFFYDMYPVQKWHLKRALEIAPNNIKVLQWIISIFDSHPDCPFSEEEMAQYREGLSSSDIE